MSIFDIISSSIVNGQLPEDFSLPKNNDNLVFADGAKDGIYLYHMQPQEINDKDYETMVEAVIAASDRNYEQADRLFLELAQNNPAIVIIDDLQDYIAKNAEVLKAGNVYEYTINLIIDSENIECVKYGLSILNLLNTNNDELKKDIRILALSDEFTLYCVSLMKTWKDGNTDIFETAKKVHGWGKIFAVEQLRALDPNYDEIRKWLLEEGINNNVAPFYSALSVWKNGNIGSILYTSPTHDEFVCIRNIIDALLDEDAVRGLSALDKKEDIIKVFLNEAKKMPLEIEDYEVIYHIREYFDDVFENKEIISLADEMLKTPNARTKILEAIRKGKGIDLGVRIGIDVRPYVLTLIKRNFKDNYYLCRYLSDNDKYRKELLYTFKNNLPLEEMVTVPKQSLGFGAEFFNENALEFLMQELREYPLEGVEFIKTGLQCEPIRTRNGALTVLQHWVSKKKKPLSEILPEINSLLIMLTALEVDESVKKRMDKLIAGETEFNEGVDSKPFSKKTLDILSDAISDVGSWRWWFTREDTVQVEFCDVHLYEYSRTEKEPHSSVIALRFTANPFLMMLDNYNEDGDKKWYDKLHDDELEPFNIEPYEFVFNNAEYVNSVLESYKNRNVIREIPEEEIVSTKYILAVKCKDVAFIAGGNELEVVTHSGNLSEEEVEESNKHWWEYWEDYWKLRGSEDAYDEDYGCEVTIPIKSS